MMVIPRQRTVRLVYPSRNAADWLGLGLSGIALGVVAAGMRRRRPVSESRPAPGPVQGAEACALPPPGRRWGGLVPGGLVLLLVASRFVSGPRHPAGDATTLYERASQAYAAGAFEEAAEYARHGAGFAPGGSPLRAELLCLRGESLARAGHPREAAEAFSGLVLEAPTSPYVAQALFGGAAAREAAGDAEGAAADRKRLRQEFSETPWARRLGAEERAKPR
jgi:TolA-binding protein